MSDDLSGFSLMDLFRSEADGQTALLTEGLLADSELPPRVGALTVFLGPAWVRHNSAALEAGYRL